MSDNTELAEKTCIPCQGNIPPLDKTAADNLLKQLQNDWRINTAGHLHKKYNFKDFMAAMAFANKIAQLAEEEKHHPDLTIAWGSCTVEIWTHKIDGLTESDFILAAKIEALQNL